MVQSTMHLLLGISFHLPFDEFVSCISCLEQKGLKRNKQTNKNHTLIQNVLLWYNVSLLTTSRFQLQPPPSSLERKEGQPVSPFLVVLQLCKSRLSQCLLVAHHVHWVPCGPRLNCEGSRSSLEPQRISVYDPPVCGHALPLNQSRYLLPCRFMPF